MIICVGEILADMIGEKRGEAFFYERKAGGAPFNVACAAKKFGARTGFVGCVGDDTIGGFLKDFARSRGLDSLDISVDEGANTTLAFVDINASGERSFCFYRKNTADYRLPEVSDELLSRASIVHIGSLMLSEQRGEKYALSLCRRVHEANRRVSFEVNFRTDIFRDVKTAVETYKRILEQADIVKFSEDELEIFTREYVERLAKDKLVCVSLGGVGSMWMYGGESKVIPSISVKPVDTTGAGDAFFAGVLSGLDGLECPYDNGKLDKIFAFANVCGALNTLGRGAIDNLPDLETVNERLRHMEEGGAV